METSYDVYWNYVSLRQSPLFIWGIGDLGLQLADSLNDWIQTQTQSAALFKVFKPESNDDLAHTFALAVAPLIEEAKQRGELSSLEVKLIAATWETEKFPLHETLTIISQVLNRLLTGNQCITLSLLVPTTLASEDERARSWQCLKATETLFEELPFLNAAFLYQTQIHTATDLGKINNAFIIELLRRECFDKELHETICQTVYPMMGLNRRFNGSKSVYSSISAQNLSFLSIELGNYFVARFTHDLLFKGLNSSTSVSKTLSAERNNHANQWADTCLPLLERGVLQTQNSSSFPVWPTILLDNEAMNKFHNGLRSAIEQSKEIGAQNIQAMLDPIIKLLEVELSAEINSHPGYLAGGMEFLKAVTGDSSEAESTEGTVLSLTGIHRITEQFIALPLLKTTDTLFAPVNQSQTEDSSSHDPKNRLYLNTQEVLNAYLGQNEFSSSNAKNLFAKLWGRFSEMYNELLTAALVNQTQQEQAEQSIQDLRTATPWYVKPVYRLSTYQKKENAVHQQQNELKTQNSEIEASFSKLLIAFKEILKQLWWPHWERTLLIDDLTSVLHEKTVQLSTYITTIEQASNTLLEKHKVFPVFDTQTKTSLPTLAQGEKIYMETWQSNKLSESVRLVFAYTGTDIPKPDYASLTNLYEHILSPPEQLIRRIKDYATNIFHPVLNKSMLDMIEFEGQENADKFFRRITEKLRSYPEFSKGLLPVAIDKKCLNHLHVIRCDPKTQTGLPNELFGQADRFINIKDTHQIDITSIFFGFPLELIHVFNVLEINSKNATT